MILELGDGRELKLPDAMEDETARQLKMFILALEERARAAEARVMLLVAEIAALRAGFSALATKPHDSVAIVQAIGRMIDTQNDNTRRTISAVLADRVMVPDSMGEMTRSKAVLR